MAKKSSAAAAKSNDRHIVKICFERIVPDEIDPERSVRRVFREHIAAKSPRPLSADELAHVSRMAVAESKKWESGRMVNCCFLDGDANMKKKVESIAHKWEQYANIGFKFAASSQAEIRVSFYADAGSWSAVGRDALNRQYFPMHQPTMNYGWLREDTSDDEYSRVVLHEFGHALGCLHEHQSPKFTRKWNVQAVMKHFQGAPNYWSKEDIQHNVLEKYSPKGISATQFDPKSIMLYEFDPVLFSDGKGPTNTNSKLSPKDIKMIRKMYM
jgi:hypothetical protein